ncbi:phage integrase family protein [Mycolicibacterium hassiacum DSM 44199]|uniref:Phage integrase family protein n=1 Tax=Mycolicibacterium hassiacum (strain DSM 44199 / CIP 105218 / JCM 12690 / 3849) TaxID=1122247 RepID=K5BET3_MYCHD|nr:site-specific integrase [Mycolicibacterium hassiacum]EKF23257.1 phage integrase family protein [Mycolicibacterium hassiacum DSM 44199]MDA4086475.1 integrase [Mycolicibacterium hassiacum DSM 44199]VCT89720.1 Putative prophage phiRv2 integrase [Mycolicibacterium hassiacum DSM 44199]
MSASRTAGPAASKDEHGNTVTVDSPLKGKVARWRVRWVDRSGMEHTKSFKIKPDAQRFANKITAELENEEFVSPRPPDTFGEIAEKWFATKSHRKPKTRAGYRELLDNIVLPRWGDVPVAKITYEDYLEWLGSLSAGGSQKGQPLSASRVTQAHQVAGAVLKYAVNTGKIRTNVAHKIKRSEDLPPPQERERVYLSQQQLIRLAKAMGRYETLTLVLGYCGIRFGEAAALRVRHVRDQTLVIHSSATNVRGMGIVETSSTKSHKPRIVPVPGPIWERLMQELPESQDALVFPSYLGRDRYLPIEEFRCALDRAKAEVGINPRMSPHDLRHTAASLAIREGANVKALQRMLGHASAAITLDRYSHLFDEDLTALANRMGKALETAAVSLRYEENQQTRIVS